MAACAIAQHEIPLAVVAAESILRRAHRVAGHRSLNVHMLGKVAVFLGAVRPFDLFPHHVVGIPARPLSIRLAERLLVGVVGVRSPGQSLRQVCRES